MTNALMRRVALLSLLASYGCGSESSAKDETDENAATGECTSENPCIDEFGAPLCPVRSDYEGDELAVCAPKSEEAGLLLHYGPSNYTDKKELKKYLLPAYAEAENCVYVRTTNKKPMWINRYNGRMRPYSHHLIVTIVDEAGADVKLGEPTDCNQIEAVGSRWLLGSQDPQIDLDIEGSTPGSLPSEPGDPEYGLGQLVQPNTLLRLDMHYINPTDKDILREGWVYLKAVPEEDVTTMIDMITFFQASIDVPPNSKGTKTKIGRCRVPSDRYIGMVTGHFHEFGTRFTMWHEKTAEGETSMIYDTKDWDLPGNAFYTRRLDNPALDAGGIWGATSGYIEAKKGDFINFQCEYDNPTNTPVRLGELGKDQMCNVFGYYYPSDGDVWNCRCLGAGCF